MTATPDNTLHGDYLSDLYKKFEVVSTYDTNIEYYAWSFCCNWFLIYADNIFTQTHRETAKIMIFRI